MWMQSFRAGPTHTGQSASGDLESIARQAARHPLRDGLGHLLGKVEGKGAVGCVFLFAITPQRGHTRRIQGSREASTC